MPTYLDAIVQRTRRDLEARKRAVPVDDLKARARDLPPPLDFAGALRAPGIQVIAEVKRASPSRGAIAPDADPVAVARAYAAAGAAAISVLTEEPHFNGRLDFLPAIKEGLDGPGPPLLRKDFIVEPYQVYESRAYRADALLLIVACLPDGELEELLGLARRLGLQCLVEAHTEDEARRAVDAGAEVIGINNRDLSTFETSLETTRRVRPVIPQDRVIVSESGIGSPEDVACLAAWGVDAFLIGEALMTAADPRARLREFLAAHD
ncbi:MAG: indole-3-glycerol phosphate synthase TrpC [Dehalococcoidia bacterium]